MALPPVRKSGRIRASKRSSFLANDYEYDETKFEGDGMIVENVTKFEVDVSSNISDLLNSHSKETNDESVKLGRRTSFPHVMSKLKKGGGGSKEVAENGEREEEEDASSSYTDMMFNLVCPLCSKQMSTKKELESHIIDRHNEEMENAGNGDTQHLSCDVCGKIMYDSASYKRHMKTHTGERPYQCGECEKSFQDSCSLKRHAKIHEDERPFSCDICLKSFRDAPSIGRHMLTHTDRPRMFQCSICDKNFTDKSGLRRHEKTHLGVRPFVCEVCDKTFIDSCSFKRHQKIHIGIKNHHCPHCKKSFMERQSLVRHMKTACRFQNDINGESIFLLEDDLTSGNDSYISNTSLGGAIEEKHHNLKPDGESRDSSNSSFSAPFPPNSLSFIGQQTMGSYVNKTFLKAAPSLSSLIKKDPKLYEGISEIVDSIDSYEKMLDLCGERGQEEIDAALTRDCNPMPDNILCFECGELLVDGVNFKSEEKIFNPSMANAFKCTSCEEEEEEDDYGEPPILMPHYNVDAVRGIEDNGLSLSQEEFESAEHLGEQSSLYNNHRFSIRGDNNGSKMFPSHSMSTDRDKSYNSKPPTIDDHIVHNKNQKNILLDEDSSLATAQQPVDPSSTSPIIEYEADDPSIPSVFPCHLCTKVFASSSFLERHLDLHKRSPYKCMVCAKSFANAPALKRHMRVHTGEKPYSCPKCSKQFKDPSNFCKHKKNCSVIPSVVCPLVDSGSTTAAKSGTSKDYKLRRDNNKNTTPSGIITTRATGVKIKRERSIAFSYDDGDCKKQEEGEVDEEEEKSLKERSNYPIMTVLPCLDEDMYNDHSPETSTYLLDNGEVMENGEIKDMNINYIPCEICEKLCSSEQHLEMHMNYHKGNPDVTCIECGKTFADPFGLKRHMRLHTGVRPFPCDYCGRGYCDNWSLKKHRSKGCLQVEVQASDLEHLLPCSQCTRVFCGPEHRQEHMKVHKGVLKYKCDVCKKGFSEAFNLKKHRRLHMAICPGCGQEFQNIKLLMNHQRTECSTESLPAKEEPEAGKTFACNICGRTYSTKAYLDRHKKIHQDIKPHVCEICNKRFSEAFKLRRHAKAAHSDHKPFVCPDCGKCFSDDAVLKRHLVSSSCALNKVMGETGGSESCVCQICHKIFQKSYMLVRHMTVHSQDRPFACDMCGRSYKDTSSLKRHQLVHQGIKDFICPICGKGFYYSDSLKRHMSGRCGAKTKRLKTSARTKKSKEYGYHSNDDFLVDGNNSVFYNNNNNVDSSLILDNESWKFKLHTLPYSPSQIPEDNLVISNNHRVKKIARNKNSKWSCVSRRHCWLCDVKASSVSVLMMHRKTHHLHVKKPFSCGKCFLRFHRKIYCKAHKLCCHNTRKFVNPNTNNTNNSSPSLMKVKRKYSTTAATAATTMLNNSHVISESVAAVSIEDTERKRPRRSVPRAQWSWLSQI